MEGYLFAVHSMMDHCTLVSYPIVECGHYWNHVYTCVQCVGNIPMVLTSNVSPPGSYSVRIVASSGVEETVTYTITDTDTNGKKYTPFKVVYYFCFDTNLSFDDCAYTGSATDQWVSSCG